MPFHGSQGEAVKADESVLSFTPGFGGRKPTSPTTGPVRAVQRRVRGSGVCVKPGPGCVFWSQIVMNSECVCVCV